MATPRKNLTIACALDADVIGQVSASAPRLDRARTDLDVVRALRRLYGEVHLVRVDHDLGSMLDAYKRINPDVVFNLALSALESEPSFAGFLDLLGVPYTGSGPMAIALANDKVRSRELLRAAGLRVPRFIEIPVGESSPRFDLTPPVIVKPAQRGCCSLGIYQDSLVATRKEALACAKRVWTRFGVPAVCDEFVVGRELRVGVVESARSGQFRISGIGACLFPGAAPGWGFKSEGIRVNPRVRRAHQVQSVPARLHRSVERELLAIANQAVRALDVRGYAALDVRVDDFGRTTIIEVNANPGLAGRSLAWRRPAFAENIDQIVRAALSRRR